MRPCHTTSVFACCWVVRSGGRVVRATPLLRNSSLLPPASIQSFSPYYLSLTHSPRVPVKSFAARARLLLPAHLARVRSLRHDVLIAPSDCPGPCTYDPYDAPWAEGCRGMAACKGRSEAIRFDEAQHHQKKKRQTSCAAAPLWMHSCP